MSGILYENVASNAFIFVTLVLGGAAGWATGRACALTWRPLTTLFFFLLLLGIAVRFIHHAMFDGSFFSIHYYIVDTLYLIVVGNLAFRLTRTRQMTTQYPWLYRRTNPLGWKKR